MYFDVVFVCTGNRYRSPIAEGLFQAATRGLPVRVISFGTYEFDGESDSMAATLAGRWGVDLSQHQPRSIDGIDLSEASLVIGFELNHVAKAVVDARAEHGRAFLLPELVEYLAQIEIPPEPDVARRATELVTSAATLRVERGPAVLREIADPVGLPLREAGRTVEQIADLTARLVARLFPAHATR